MVGDPTQNHELIQNVWVIWNDSFNHLHRISWFQCELRRWQHLLWGCQKLGRRSLAGGSRSLGEGVEVGSPAPLPISSRFSSSPCDQLPHAPCLPHHDRPGPFLTGRQHSPSSLNSMSRIWLQQWMRKLTNTLLWTLSIHFLLSSIIICHLYPCCQCPASNLLPTGSPGLSLRLLTVLLCGLFLAFKTQAQIPRAALGEALEDPAGEWLTLPVSNSSTDTSSHSPMSVLSLCRISKWVCWLYLQPWAAETKVYSKCLRKSVVRSEHHRSLCCQQSCADITC